MVQTSQSLGIVQASVPLLPCWECPAWEAHLYLSSRNTDEWKLHPGVHFFQRLFIKNTTAYLFPLRDNLSLRAHLHSLRLQQTLKRLPLQLASLMFLWFCFCDASVVLLWCFGGASVLLLWCFGGASVMFRWCFGSALMMLQGCFYDASVVLFKALLKLGRCPVCGCLVSPTCNTSKTKRS